MNTGDYARTKSGIIGKLIIKEDTIAVAKWQGGYELQDTTTYIINDEKVYKNEIIKSSPNIIDLIEVGDYVNGHKVTAFMYDGKNNRIGVVVNSEQWAYDDNEIKLIVTKEQFKNMEYKL